MQGGDTLKPKCFKEADIPKQRLASNAIWVQRNIHDEVIKDLEMLIAESPYLFIAWKVSFSSGNSQNVIREHLFSSGTGRSRNSARSPAAQMTFCPIKGKLFSSKLQSSFLPNASFHPVTKISSRLLSSM